MLKPQFILNLAAKIVAVLFAGAGGSCTGIEQAIGRHVDIAANHNPTALSCHQRNHPQTRHYREDVRRLNPREICGNQPVGYLHLSPDCTHHSQAKGGQPRSDEIRSLSWVALRWTGTVRPDVITLENVREILKWGRLIAKRDPKTGRVVKLDGSVAAPGEVVPRAQQFLVPDPKRIGETWAKFVAALRRQGYVVEWKVLRAANYGVPTKRTRLFLVARCDGMPIVWPEQSHFEKPKRGQKAWVPIHTCLDFSIKSQSIFDREKPLVDATLRRVARGLKKYVLDDPNPFIVEGARYDIADIQVRDGGGNVIAPTIVPITHGGGDRFHDARDPLASITTAHRGEFMLATHTMVQVSYGERKGQEPRVLDIRSPGGTGGQHHALVEYHLSPQAEAGALRCAAFLIQYYSEGGQWGDVRDPSAAITTRDHLALVTVWIKGDPYVIVDICLRMLVPRELALAMSFPRSYDIETGHDGRKFTKTQQVFMIGNAVPPELQRVVTAANYSDLPYSAMREAA